MYDEAFPRLTDGNGDRGRKEEELPDNVKQPIRGSNSTSIQNNDLRSKTAVNKSLGFVSVSEINQESIILYMESFKKFQIPATG